MYTYKPRLALSAVLTLIGLLTIMDLPHAAQLSLTWKDPNNDPTQVGGYNLYYWQDDWNEPANVDVGDNTFYTLIDLEPGQTYYFAVTVYDLNGGHESAYSNVVSEAILDATPLPDGNPPPPPGQDPPPGPGGGIAPIIIEAESMSLDGYWQENNGSASGGALISRQGGREGEDESPMGTASTTFSGEQGTFDVIVSYFDEQDGRSQLAFAVNGAVQDEWIANEDLPGRNPSSTTLTSRTVAQGLSLQPGDVIELQGRENRREYACFDKIEFVRID